MNGFGLWHYAKMGGVVKGICGEQEVADGVNVVLYEELFFGKREQERCPNCETMLLEQRKKHLTSLFQELRGICNEAVRVLPELDKEHPQRGLNELRADIDHLHGILKKLREACQKILNMPVA